MVKGKRMRLLVLVNKMLLPCDFAPHNQWQMAYTAVNAESFWW